MYYHCLRLIMNIQSSKNDKWNNRANIGLYAMVLIVNIKFVQRWLPASADSWTWLITVGPHRYSGSLEVEKSKHAGRVKHISAVLSPQEVK